MAQPPRHALPGPLLRGGLAFAPQPTQAGRSPGSFSPAPAKSGVEKGAPPSPNNDFEKKTALFQAMGQFFSEFGKIFSEISFILSRGREGKDRKSVV